MRTQTKKPHRRKPVGFSGRPIIADPLDDVGLPIALAMAVLEIVIFTHLMGWL